MANEVQFNEKIIPALAERANKLDAVLRRIEVEIEKVKVEGMNTEDLVKFYALVSRNHMDALEFIRKIALLPKPDDSPAKRLVERILSLPMEQILQLEKSLAESEAKL